MVTPIIVAGLVIAAVWGLWLLPGILGERRTTPVNSTEEFDRLTRMMAEVRREGYDAQRASVRDTVRMRRRRTTAVLIVLAVVTAMAAWRLQSLNWLLVHLGIDACLAWYIAMLSQLRQRHAARLASRYFTEGPDWDESRVRVINR
jgi:hypothetical protein